MRRLIDRYLINEFMPPFFFAIFALTFILLMDQLFRLIDLIVRKGLPLDIVGQILIYTLPLIISFTAPMAVLVAIVMSFGRFSQDNEILALKTSGLSFLSITKTPFIIISIFTIFLVLFNNYILPESNHRVRNLMLDVSRKRPAVRLPEGVFTNDLPGYTIHIKKKDEKTSKICDVTIYDLRNGVMITAPNGELKNIEEEGILRFILYDGELHQLIDSIKYQKTKFTKQIINIQLNTDLVRKERKTRSEDELDVNGLNTKIGELSREIANLKKESAQISERALDKFLKGNTHSLEVAQFQIGQMLSVIKGKTRDRGRYLIEVHKKFSLAFACIVFLVIGAPLGYLFRRGGVAGTLLGILLFSLYYILIISGEEFADRRNFSPFWAMWLPNIIILIIGIYLFLVAEYERSPLKDFIKRKMLRL